MPQVGDVRPETAGGDHDEHQSTGIALQPAGRRGQRNNEKSDRDFGGEPRRDQVTRHRPVTRVLDDVDADEDGGRDACECQAERANVARRAHDHPNGRGGDDEQRQPEQRNERGVSIFEIEEHGSEREQQLERVDLGRYGQQRGSLPIDDCARPAAQDQEPRRVGEHCNAGREDEASRSRSRRVRATIRTAQRKPDSGATAWRCITRGRPRPRRAPTSPCRPSHRP